MSQADPTTAEPNDSDIFLEKISLEKEPDLSFCAPFIPSTAEDVTNCYKLLIEMLEAKYGIPSTANYQFSTKVTAQDLSNIYYIHDNFLPGSERASLRENWIIDQMHQTHNLEDEVSTTVF